MPNPTAPLDWLLQATGEAQDPGGTPPTAPPPTIRPGYTRIGRRRTRPDGAEERPNIEAVQLQDVRSQGGAVTITARFIAETTGNTVLNFCFDAPAAPPYVPYVNRLADHVAELLRNVQNLPTPPRPELPHATIGERLYNMLDLLMDREGNDALQQEWQALRLEYEQYMAERF